MTADQTPAPAGALRSAAGATRWMFLLCGIASAAWASLVPFVKARLALPDAELGLVMLCLGGGAIVTMPLGGLLIHRIGSRDSMVLAGLAIAIILPLLAIAPTTPLVAVLLALYGAALGTLDIGMNAQAVAVQARIGRPMMSGFHGLFSAGGLAGALILSLALRAGLSITLAALAIAAATAIVSLLQRRRLLPPSADLRGDGPALALPRGGALVLGILCFIAFLAEGAVLDWSAVFLRFSRDLPAAWAGLGYAAFSVAMVAGRLTGDRLTTRLGPVRLTRWGAILAAAGFALATATTSVAAAMAGFTLIGLGAANLVPAIFNAAGRLRSVPAHLGISAVSILGYAGLLAGPTAIGLASRLTSLPIALAGVGVLALVLAGSARRVLPER